MLPLGVFRSRTFSAVNGVTFLVYAALGGVFFFVVIQLQVVSGFSPAGRRTVPVAGHAADARSLGPRRGTVHPDRTAAAHDRRPVSCARSACSGWPRVGADAVYWSDVLPYVVVLGLGLSLTVAPLTATALAAVEDRHVGLASGVNNAVARTAGLLPWRSCRWSRASVPVSPTP